MEVHGPVASIAHAGEIVVVRHDPVDEQSSLRGVFFHAARVVHQGDSLKRRGWHPPQVSLKIDGWVSFWR